MMMKLSNATKKLESIFDALNKRYFDAKLPQPAITIQSSPTAYGHCTVGKAWNNEAYEINISAEYLNRPLIDTVATMLHEMVHLYHNVNDIKGTSNGHRYHNKLFKADAEARDLIITQAPGIGWSVTKASQALADWVTSEIGEKALPIAREGGSLDSGSGDVPIPKPKKSSSKYYKYYCPVCGARIYSARPVSMRCEDCDEEMIRY